jgi:hypothetical protein
LAIMSASKLLVPRIKSFNEINLDFYFFNDSVFHLGKKNTLPMFRIVKEELDRGEKERIVEKNETLAEMCL